MHFIVNRVQPLEKKGTVQFLMSQNIKSRHNKLYEYSFRI